MGGGLGYFITGGVSIVIFFFVFKIIFPEGEQNRA